MKDEVAGGPAFSKEFEKLIRWGATLTLIQKRFKTPKNVQRMD